LRGWQWTACDGTPGRLAMGNLDGSLWDDWTARRTGLAIDARDVWLGVGRWIGRARQWIRAQQYGSASDDGLDGLDNGRLGGRAMYGSASDDGLDGLDNGRLGGRAMYGSAVARCMALRRTMGTARRWDRSA
jgi:hypothetical protein